MGEEKKTHAHHHEHGENCCCGHEHHHEEHEHHAHHHEHEEGCCCGHEHHHEEHEHHAHHHEHGEGCCCGHEHHHEEHEHHAHHHEHGEGCCCGHEHHHEEQEHHHRHVADNIPRKVYIIENIDCANCAAKMEKKINELPGVEDATITFATKQLRLAAKNPDALLPKIREICTSIESQVVIKEQRKEREKLIRKKIMENVICLRLFLEQFYLQQEKSWRIWA